MSNDISTNSSGGPHFRPNLESLGGAPGKMKNGQSAVPLKQGQGSVGVPTASMTATDEQKKALKNHTFKPLDSKNFNWHKGN